MEYPRYIKSYLKECLDDTPVVLLHGPRQSGKSTLAIDVGGKRYRYITLDDSTELEAAKKDPRGYIEGLPDYCIIDEIQKAPELFPSIKLAVDRQRQAGRFLLTGSSNVLAIPLLNESLAGRMEVVHLSPLAQTEIEKSDVNVLADLFSGRPYRKDFPKRLGPQLAERVISGGYPEPLLRSSPKRRKAWYSSYLSIIMQKDIDDISNIQHKDEIPKILKKVANNSARLANNSELNQGLSIDVKTARSYLQLLKHIFLVEQLEPWHSNRNKRLIKSPKNHLTDTGLLCAILNLTADQLLKERELMGSIVETFVFNELKKHAGWYEDQVEFFHYRDKDRYEVDIVLQGGSGALVGVEIKLAASVTGSDFSGLRRFQRQYEGRFVGGYVIYDGERSHTFGDGLYAIPIQALWE